MTLYTSYIRQNAPTTPDFSVGSACFVPRGIFGAVSPAHCFTSRQSAYIPRMPSGSAKYLSP